jgi:PhzF family phenazine biosynthesis protein
MALPLFQIDAFTATPFAGNPAAVCFLEQPAPDLWMQQVAQEMNLSETAFLLPEKDGYRLRWFTPVMEVKLCGHATLASAHALWESGRLGPDQPARFYTLSGLLGADGEGQQIRLDFPSAPTQPCDPPEGLLEALGVEATFVGKNQHDYLVEVGEETQVREVCPRFDLLTRVSTRGVIVTSRADRRENEPIAYDFVSRFFAPAAGVPEDPVTGSAHCCLAPHWGPRLHKTEMWGYQASPRGGQVGVRLAGDRVHLLGQAVTVLRGELLPPP